MLDKFTNYLLKKMYNKSIYICNKIDEIVCISNKQNTQDFINWQDALNKISVK